MLRILTILGICVIKTFSIYSLEYDYSAESLIRSYSQGLYFKGKFGLSQRFYGFQEKILYGHIRTDIELKSSGTVNTISSMIELYPISFLGLYSGYSLSSRKNDKLPTFNCEQVICESDEVKRKIWGIKTALQLKSVYFLFDQNFNSSSIKNNSTKNYAEELGTLISSSGKDVLSQTLGVLGYHLSDKQSIGILAKYNSMRNFKNRSSMFISFIRMSFGKWNILTGPGVFMTRQKTSHFSFLAILKYEGRKGNLLF